MVLPHAQPGEVIDVHPLGPALGGTRTATLVKTPTLEVIRLIIPADKEVCHHHEMTGEVMVHCLEGLITVQINGDSRVLEAGQTLYLRRAAAFALRDRGCLGALDDPAGLAKSCTGEDSARGKTFRPRNG